MSISIKASTILTAYSPAPIDLYFTRRSSLCCWKFWPVWERNHSSRQSREQGHLFLGWDWSPVW